MTHDANFVDNRLRLAAFLRVVEEGIPPRPSRFRRRIQVPDEAAEPPVATSQSQTNQVLLAPEAHQEPPISSSASPIAFRSIAAAVEKKAATGVEVGVLSEVETEYRLQPGSIYDVPLSPTSTEPRSSPASGDDQDLHERQSPVERQPDTNRSAKFAQKAGTAVPVKVKVKKASRKPLGSSSTRKRRLPVNELALLRTTTSDGLPQSGDADVAFATPITVIDPIQDSQIQKPFDAVTPNLQRPHDVIIFKRRASPRMAPQPKPGSPLRDRKFKSPTKPNQDRLGPSELFPQSRLGMQFAPDGFVGCELQSTSHTGRTSRSKTLPARRKKKPIVVRELALGSGPLPVMVIENTGTSMAHANENSLYLNHLPTTSEREEHQNKVKPGQLVLARSQSATLGERTREDLPKQCDKTILHQLSSITAPLRRESGTSESDTTGEEGDMDSEDGNDTDNDDAVDGYDAHYLLSTQVPTFADDKRYFQTATQRLENGGFVVNGGDDFWSQYGPMD